MIQNTIRQVSVLIETDDSWGRSVVEAIAEHAHTANWTLLLCPRDQQRRLRLPVGWRGDGALVSLRDQSMAKHLRSCRIPAVDVSITMPAETWLGRVATNDSLRAEFALEHFRARGFSRFATYAPPIGRYPNGREQAFADLVERSGFECHRFACDSNRQNSGWMANYQAASSWLAAIPKPLAVFASDPYPARQLAEICSRTGFHVPEEVAILSGDNDELLCQIATPQLSSIELSCRRIGTEACRMLTELMNGAKPSKQPTLIPPLRVLARHSTDVLSINDPEFAKILSHLRDRATLGIEVRDILREFPISRRSLELKFKRFLGRSPAAEIRRTRLEQAKRLLRESDSSIEAIATECGIASGPTLSQLFRKHVGMTPGQFRAEGVSL